MSFNHSVIAQSNQNIANANYRLHKDTLDHCMQSYFAIPAQYHAELAEYKLFYWSSAYLVNVLVNSDSLRSFKKDNVKYVHRLLDCSHAELEWLSINHPTSQVKMSFRRARKHFMLDNFVLINLPIETKKLLKSFEQIA